MIEPIIPIPEEGMPVAESGGVSGYTLPPLQWTVAVDVGTSGTKVCCFGESPEYPFQVIERVDLVSPYVRVLTRSSYEAALEYRGEGQRSLSGGLVSFDHPQTGERLYWQLGETAARPGWLPVGRRKFESCLVKVLGVLGSLVTQVWATTDPVNLTLGVLLPLSELEDRFSLASWLRQTVPNFSFNGTAIHNLSFVRLDCKPEGYGLYRAYESKRVLLVGHRDSTWLSFTQGQLNLKRSVTLPETGMHDFIRSIRFPITDELAAAQALSLAGRKLTPKALLPLTQTRSQMELKQLRQAIRESLEQYWRERQEQFQALSRTVGEIVPVSGGAAHYFAVELQELFEKQFRLQLHWCDDLQAEFCQRFGRDQTDPTFKQRFVDIYAYGRSLPGPGLETSVPMIPGATHA